MIYPLNPVLMELLVLAMICQKDSYGYQISQQMKCVSNLKDSALYPVLRRLAENQFVDIYDQQYQGRNRKYYRVTETGRRQKEYLEQEWKEHVKAVLDILESSSPAQEQEKQEISSPAQEQEKQEISSPAQEQEKHEKQEISSPAQEHENLEGSDAPEGGNDE
ncbi:MAG: PadR family transcriptional regulator [Eubacterium sp.]|nr:PadR family transcriptional regulator [Eubacterium sp.]